MDEDCSEDAQEVYDINDNTAEYCGDLFDSGTDEDNILNLRRGQKERNL